VQIPQALTLALPLRMDLITNVAVR